jgi:hypothetical protein
VAVLVALVLAGCAGQPGPPSATPIPTQTQAATATPAATGSPQTTETPTATPTSIPSASPPATVEPSAGAFPATILGMPVISVADAEALANTGKLDGRLAAVGGYWNWFALPCPFLPHQAVITGFCSGSLFADTADAVRDYNGGLGSGPNSAAESGNGDLLWSTSGSGPAAVVLIVHAGDSRSWQCLERAACQKRMVVDSVAWFNGSATQLPQPAADIAPKLSLADIEGMAAKSEQLVTAYPMLATQLNDVDPRFLGKGSGIVWYLRLAKTPSGADGLNEGVVRLVSDDSSTVIDELPLPVSSDYQPARVILDGNPANQNSQTAYPHYTITSGAATLSDDLLGMSTPPVALEAGAYELHAFLSDSNGQQADGPKCDQPITLTSSANVAYLATFTANKCDWATEESQF